LNARHFLIFSCATVLALSLVVTPQAPEVSAQVPEISTVRSGRWSDRGVWSARRLPARGESVIVGAGHDVIYDIHSDVEIGRLMIQGSLRFARDRSTRLDIGNIVISRGGYLEVGAPGALMPAGVTAEIRFLPAR